MSNGTQEQNRSNGNSRNRNRNRSRNRNNGRRSDQNNNSSKPRPPSQHQKFVSKAPAKLTFWQKLLKLVGLYKEPAKPIRGEQRTSSQPRLDDRQDDRQPKQAARSNTRDARNSGEFKKSEPRPPRERREPSLADVESTRLYIGNLSYDATESDIEELFKGVGPVRSVEIVYNKHTHKSKGYGFVEMLRIDEAKRAVEVLHDQHFMGRQLIVSGAKAKSAEDPEERADARERKENQVSEASAPAVTEVVHSLEPEEQKETFA